LFAQGLFVAPMSKAVSVAQNRQAEKAFLSHCVDKTGIPTAPYAQQSN
jgi:5-(carboxyamino)imidazole ribonucleotide synthase